MSESYLNTPILWINAYLQEKLAQFISPDGSDLISSGSNEPGIGIPFFPTKPSTIDELTEQWVVINDTRYQFNGVFAVWDRMFRMRRKPFPHRKEEQVLYYFYATQSGVERHMIQVQEAILRLLDRGDESAQELNTWARQKGVINIGTQANPINVTTKFLFHEFKVYQLEETRDIVDFGTARTFGANKVIIDYSYHQHDDVISQS
jgi:hypothetical protein